MYDIAFIILVVVLVSWLIWELIPDPAKKYWNYLRMVRQDRRLGRKRKYTFSFRNGVNQERY